VQNGQSTSPISAPLTPAPRDTTKIRVVSPDVRVSAPRECLPSFPQAHRAGEGLQGGLPLLRGHDAGAGDGTHGQEARGGRGHVLA
jgi:hypothetical protein